ncbi:MAG: hypothetical protein ACM3SO_00010 [Betaproteobacteria bacterium]
MRHAAFPFAVLALSGALLQPAHATTFVDAFAAVEQDPNCDGCRRGVGGSFWLAQTFLVATDGKLEGVVLPLSCGAGKLLVAITDSNAQGPGQNVLSWTYLDTAKLAVFPRMTLVRLPRAQLTAGMSLAIVLGNPEAQLGQCGVTLAHTDTHFTDFPHFERTDAYPNGHMYQLGTDGHWVWSNNLGFGGQIDDMGFQVLLSTPGSDD